MVKKSIDEQLLFRISQFLRASIFLRAATFSMKLFLLTKYTFSVNTISKQLTLGSKPLCKYRIEKKVEREGEGVQNTELSCVA